MTRQPRPITILMADDDPDDRQMTKEAFEEARLANDLRFVEDGEELMDYLHRRGRYSDPADAPRPDLILLDLNMPRKDGRETLAAIKADDTLKAIPVVILTTSGAEPDIVSSYQHRANAYVTKPFGLDEFEATVRKIDRFYRDVAVLPSQT